MKNEGPEMQNLIESLSPIERKIIPFLKEPLNKIEEKSGLDSVSVQRALRFLEAKGALTLSISNTNIIELDTNGIYYKKNHLPERNLISILESNNHISLEEAKKISKLSENEFKVALGVLKSKAFISLSSGKLSLTATKAEISKKMLEEQLIESLPAEKETLPPELMLAFENLKKRKNIIEIKQKQNISFNLTPVGEKLAGQEINLDLVEEVTPEIIKNWSRQKKFRKYDLKISVPHINGGKRHFVNQSIEYGKKIWTDLGFKEMEGPMIDSAFWVFDSLFTPQDHPAREMQDTFFIKNSEKTLPDKKIVSAVQQSHESGVSGSKGWRYSWKVSDAKKTVMRTHTTGLSARTLSSLKHSQLPAKYFALGKVFRNETVDWSHGFEFYQTEGIVVDENANFRQLLGYLKEFYRKMGYEKIKFVPSFFTYTEPSVEIQVFDEKRKIWIELGGAGMFRPEVTIPLLGKHIPVLAWGQGFDRIIMEHYSIKDLREMYSNNLKDLRNRKVWI